MERKDLVTYLQGFIFAEVSMTAWNIKYSGNLARHVVNLGHGKIRISAPAYKVVGTKSKGPYAGTPKIQLTHAKIGKTEFTHYAWLLNEVGSWGKRQKNVDWCRDAIVRGCYYFQGMLGGSEECIVDVRI